MQYKGDGLFRERTTLHRGKRAQERPKCNAYYELGPGQKESGVQVMLKLGCLTSWLTLRFHSLACSSGSTFFSNSRRMFQNFPPSLSQRPCFLSPFRYLPVYNPPPQMRYTGCLTQQIKLLILREDQSFPHFEESLLLLSVLSRQSDLIRSGTISVHGAWPIAVELAGVPPVERKRVGGFHYVINIVFYVQGVGDIFSQTDIFSQAVCSVMF